MVTLDDVAARWPGADHDALAAVSLHLGPGAHAQVIGPSGSGKSTLAAVLVGFLAPRSGTYRLGRADVAEVTGEEVRRRVTWIQQLPWIADSSVRENLRIAYPAATDEELDAALGAVRLGGWFHHLPAGLDSQRRSRWVVPPTTHEAPTPHPEPTFRHEHRQGGTVTSVVRARLIADRTGSVDIESLVVALVGFGVDTARYVGVERNVGVGVEFIHDGAVRFAVVVVASAGACAERESDDEHQ